MRKNVFLRAFAAFLILQYNLLQAYPVYAQVVIENELPQGANVVAGSASFDSSANTLNITTSDRPIIEWNSFNIGQVNTVNFLQPDSASVALNRVTGVDPSLIYGALNANGRVFVVNPNGVYFGPGTRVDVNGLVASSLNISNGDFLAGNYNFFKDGSGSWVVNRGDIIANGGYVALLAGAIENSGTIQAPLGRVGLAAGEQITVGLDNQSDISIAIDEAVKNDVFGPDGQKMTDAIKNTGTIAVDGGSISLNAKTLNGIFDNAINNAGIIQANSLVSRNGRIELIADGGAIKAEAGSMTSAKAVEDNDQGGRIYFYALNNDVSIMDEAILDVSGGAVSGDAGYIQLCATNDLSFRGILNGFAAEGYHQGEAILDPASASITGAVNADTTVWATGNITITGNVALGAGYTLNLYADNNSGASQDWHDGVGTVTRTGAFTITGGGGSYVNIEAGSGIGVSATAIQLNTIDGLTAMINPSGTNGIYINNAGGTALTVSSLSTNNAAVTLTSAAAGIVLTGALNAGSGIVTMTATTAGGVDASVGTVTAGSLRLTGVGTYDFSGANDVDNIAGSFTGALTFNDIDDLTVNTVTTVGITTGGNDAILTSGGLLSLTRAVTTGVGNIYLNSSGGITQTTGIVSGAGVAISSTGGNVDMSSATNAIATMAANVDGGTFFYRDSNTLTVGTVGALTGVTVGSSMDATIQTGGLMTINNDITDAGGSVKLQTTTGMTESGGVVTAANLLLFGAGAYTMTGNNDVDVLAVSNTNAATSFTDIDDLTIDTVLGTAGITSRTPTLNTGGLLTLNQNISASGYTTTLNPTADGVNQAGGTVTSTSVLLTGAGTFNLTSANVITTLAANVTGAISYTDFDALAIGTVGATSGIMSNGYDIIINSGSTMTISQNIDVGAANITLSPAAGAGISQSGGAITAAGLLLTGVGTTYGLTRASNDIDFLAANIDGILNFTDVDDFSVDTVLGISGIETTGKAFTVIAGDTVTLNQGINAAGAIVTFTPAAGGMGGGINQTAGGITAASLRLLGAGNINLTGTNDIDTIASANTGSLTFTDIDDLIVGTVTTNGITTTNDVTLNTGDQITLSRNIAVTAANITLNPLVGALGGGVSQGVGILTGGGLLLLGGGPFSLTLATNNFTTIAGNFAGSLSYRDAGAVTVGSVGGYDGLVSNGSDVTLTTAGVITLDQNIDAAAATVSLSTTAAGITQNAGGITAASLRLTGTGAFSLTGTNDVDTFASLSSLALTFNDVDDFTVDTVLGTVGINGTSHNITLTAGDLITLNQSITATASILSMSAAAGALGGGINQTAGTLAGTSLLILGDGPFSLTSATNAFTTIAANLNSGSLTYTDLNTLTVGTVSGTVGITNASGDVTLNNTGTLTLTNDVNVSGMLSLNPGAGAITETGTITAGGLQVSGTNNYTLTGAVDALAANITGNFTFTDTDADGFTVDTILGVAGITTSGNTTLTSGDIVTLNADINASAIKITTAIGDSSVGGINQTAGGVIGTSLALVGTGPVVMSSATNDVDTFASSVTGATTYTDIDDLTIGTASAVTGIVSGGSDVALTTGDTLTIGAVINSGANVTLTSAIGASTVGGVNQTAGIITAGGLAIVGAGTFSFLGTNVVDTLAANITSALTYTDADTLWVGDVNGVVGITSGDFDVNITTGDTLSLVSDINVGAANLKLDTAIGASTIGGVNQTAGIVTAAGLALVGAGTFTFLGTNVINTLAANITGTLDYTDPDALTVDTVAGVTGIATGGNNVTLTTSDTLTLNADINSGALVALNIGSGGVGGVNQTAGVITATGLSLGGQGAFTFSGINDVDTLAALLGSGALTFTDIDDLTIDTISGTVGIFVPGFDINITTGDTLTLAADINAGSANVILNSVIGASTIGGVNQTAGVISAAGLSLTGSGVFSFTGANAVGSLAANTTDGALTYTSASGLSVDTVNGITGITTNGYDVNLSTTSGMAVNADINAGAANVILNDTTVGVNQTGGTITATGLALTGAGTFSFLGANAIDSLAANISGGAFSYVDPNALTIDTINGVAGITTDGYDINIAALAALTLNSDLNAGAGNVNLTNTDVGIDQTSGSIIAAGLSLTALNSGNFNLSSATNNVNTLAVVTAGDLSYTDADTLSLGTVNGVSGLSIIGGSHSYTINTGGKLTLEELINVTGTLTLNSADGIDQTGGGVWTNELLLAGTGTFSLTNSNNYIDGFAANVDGDLTFTENNIVYIQTVNGVSGITTNGHDFTLNTLDALGNSTDISQDINVGAGTINLVSVTDGGGFNQTGGVITAAGLALTGSGTFSFTGANTVGSLAANITGGALTYTDADSLTVDTVNGVTGITTDGYDVTLNTGDTLTQNADINVGAATVTMNSANGVDQTAGIVIADTIHFQGTGTFNLPGMNQVSTIINDISSGTLTFGGLDLTLDPVAIGLLAPGDISFTAIRDIFLNDLLTINDNISLTAGRDININNTLTTNNHRALLVAGRAINLAGSIDAGTEYVGLNAGTDGVVQSMGGITAEGVDLGGTGQFDLMGSNDLHYLSGSFTGGLNFNDIDDLALVETLNTYGGVAITSNGNDINLTTGDTLTLGLDINAGAGTIVINSSNGLWNVGNVTANALLMTGTGSFDIGTSGGGYVGTLAANITGGYLSYSGWDGLSIGTVNGVNGVTGDQDVFLHMRSGLMTLNENVNAGAMASLEASDIGIDQVGGGITSDTVKIFGTATGGFSLTGANNVNTLAADISSSLSFTDIDTLTIDTVNGVTGITATNYDVTLNTGNTGSGLTLNADINVGSGNVMLSNQSGGINQTGGGIIAFGLSLTGTETFSLTGANSVTNLSANITGGTLAYTDVADLTIDTVNGVAGITTNGYDVTLITAADLTINSDINVGAGNVILNSTYTFLGGSGVNQTGGIITAAGLALTGAGTFWLTGANAVDTLAFSGTGGAFTYTDADSVTIDTVNGIVGVTNSGYDITLNTVTGLTINSDINAGAANVILNDSSVGVNQTAGTITATGLSLTGAGTFSLTSANAVDSLSANITGGALTYFDADSLTIDTVNSVIGIATGGYDVTLNTVGGLTINSDINAGAANVMLNDSSVGVNQTAGTITGGLVLGGSGTFSILGSNTLTGLAANITGATFTYTDADALTIDTINGVAGITNSGYDININTATGLTINSDINSGSGNVVLNDLSVGVNQTAGTITAAGLAITGAGSFSFLGTNVVNTLAANITGGALTYTDADSLTIDTVSGVTGITTDNQDVTLNTASGLTLNADIDSGAVVSLNSTAGGVNQAAGRITASGLALTGGGVFALGSLTNNVVMLAGSVNGDLSYTDVDDLTVGIVNGVTGIATGGNNLILLTGGLLTLDADIDATGAMVHLRTGLGGYSDAGIEQTAGGIIADSLSLESYEASYSNLINLVGSNDVNRISATLTKGLVFADVDDLTVGTVNGQDGITTGGYGGVVLNTGGALILDGRVDGTSLNMDSAGGITQSAGGISTGDLLLRGSGSFDLTSTTNAVYGYFAADITGSLSYTSADLGVGYDFTLGTVNAVSGITTNGYDLNLVSADTMVLSAPINVGGANVVLDSTNGITQSGGSMVAGGLAVSGGGTFVLDGTNNVNTLAANITGGALTYTDTDSLTVDTVNGVTGITTDGHDVTLSTGDSLTQNADINVGAATVTMNSANGVDQTAGIVTADTIHFQGTGTFNLPGMNQVSAIINDISSGTLTFGGLDLTLDPVAIGLLAPGDISFTAIRDIFLNDLLTINDNISLTAGRDININNSLTTNNHNINFIAGGAINLAGDLNAGTGMMVLDAAGGINQSSGTITASGLSLSGVGAFTMQAANNVDTLAANINGALDYKDIDAITIDTVNGISGIATNGSLLILETLSGLMTLNADINVGAADIVLSAAGLNQTGGTIAASGLTLYGTGSFNLLSLNDIDTLAADITGSLAYTDVDTLSVGTIDAVSGITTDGYDVSLTTGGMLSLDADITDASNVNLDSANGVDSQYAGGIDASGLSLTGSGLFIFTNANQNVDTLAANIAGPLVYSDVDELSVGTVNGVSGIATTGGSVNITTGDALTLAADIDTTGWPVNVVLEAITGGINQTAGTITSAGLALRGQGTFSLNRANDVNTFAANITGPLTYRDIDALTVDAIYSYNTTSGITTDNHNVTLTTGGSLTLTEDIDSGTGTVVINGVQTWPVVPESVVPPTTNSTSTTTSQSTTNNQPAAVATQVAATIQQLVLPQAGNLDFRVFSPVSDFISSPVSGAMNEPSFAMGSTASKTSKQDKPDSAKEQTDDEKKDKDSLKNEGASQPAGAVPSAANALPASTLPLL